MRNMVIVFSFAFFSACIGATKEVVIAWKFGVSEIVDAYQFLFALTQWPLSILAGGFAASLVPLVARIQIDSNSGLSQFRSEAFGAALGLSVPVCAFVYCIFELLVGGEFLELHDGVQEIAARMVLPMSIVVGTGIVAVIAGGWILAENRQVNTLLQSVPAVFVILAVLTVSDHESALAWGTVVGFLIYAVLSWAAQSSRMGSRIPSFDFSSPHWQTLLVGMGTLFLGQVFMSLVTLLDQFFAAELGIGKLSILGYSSRVLGLILGLVAVAINRSMLPVLSRVHNDNPSKVLKIATRFAILVFLGGVVVGLIVLLFAEQIVSIIYERGAFTAADTSEVANLVCYSMLQVPFYLASMVFVSALLSQSNFRAILYSAIVNGLVKVSLSIVLVPPLGLAGLLIATAGVYFASMTQCWFYLRFGKQAGSSS